MPWQDWVFFIGNWIGVAFLIPTIRGKQKPELSTSLVTSTIAYIFVISFVALGLWLSAFATLGVAVGWTILAYQRWKQPKSKDSLLRGNDKKKQ